MYAAAGGASLASRQARQKKRRQNQSDRLQQIKSQKFDNKFAPRQFQNYTEPKIKLSRIERNALQPPDLQGDARRHSTSHLKEPSRARIKESPSVLIPVPNSLNQQHQSHHQQHHPPPHHLLASHHQQDVPLTPTTLVGTRERRPESLHPSCSIQSHLPQILMPPEGDNKLERRCSFVRQVEEMGKCHEEDGGLTDRCNHICNFEIQDSKQQWDNNLTYYSEFHRSAFGSLDYPFSEIHDSSYGGDSEEDIFAVYHQSAAANALLYVGLGTTAIGSVVFFVGSGDKGFKTLELRLIGPTLVACGLLCCLIRILLCACPSTCLRRRKKTRLKNACPHSTSARYPLNNPDKCGAGDFLAMDPSTTTSLLSKQKKRVSIAHRSKPGTSGTCQHHHHDHHFHQEGLPHCSSADECDEHDVADASGGGGVFEASSSVRRSVDKVTEATVPTGTAAPHNYRDFLVEDIVDESAEEAGCIELQSLDMVYDLESITSNDDSERVVIENEIGYNEKRSKLTRTRVPVHSNGGGTGGGVPNENNDETCLSIVVERSDNDASDRAEKQGSERAPTEGERASHSGILLSPLQLEH